MGKKIITFYAKKFCLSGPMHFLLFLEIRYKRDALRKGQESGESHSNMESRGRGI